MSGITKILLVDDHKMFRDGLRAIIEKVTDLEIIAEADNGRTALRLARKYKPDVAIMDIAMPELNGVDAARQILAELPDLKIIAVSMHSERQYIENMLRAGVRGYLLKDCAAEELVNSINLVRAGRIYLSPEITATVVREYLGKPGYDGEQAGVSLSMREREVLQLIAEGQNSRTISAHLQISIKTVESHRKHIMEKLQLFTVAELTKFALREGLTSLDS